MPDLRILTTLALLFLLTACHQPPTVEEPPTGATVPVEVVVSGVRNDTGDVLLSVFTAVEGFPCESQHASALFEKPATTGEMLFNIELPADRQVAVAILHDENSDKALDLVMGLIPSEGFAVSNNSKGMASQNYEKAVITPQSGMRLQLEMQYYK